MAGEAAGKRVIDFLTKCTDPFHTVSEVSKRLTGSGFVHMPEQSVWTKGALQRGGKYFVTRNGSCLCAFVVGSKYQPGNAMKMVSGNLLGCFYSLPVEFIENNFFSMNFNIYLSEFFLA